MESTHHLVRIRVTKETALQDEAKLASRNGNGKIYSGSTHLEKIFKYEKKKVSVYLGHLLYLRDNEMFISYDYK